MVLAKDLTILETLEKAETIILYRSTKATTLWDVSKNKGLRTLEITDFSKIEEIDQLSRAKHIDNLILGGGVGGKPIKLKSLKPLSTLTNLKYLSLTNLRVEDDSLQPLGHLKNLERLELANRFETKEYAWLATRLPNTKCRMFQATNSCKITDSYDRLLSDTMITGRRKPFLLSTKDHVKIDKYVKDFEKLKKELAE